MTPDPAWVGAYAEGARFKIRRLRAQKLSDRIDQALNQMRGVSESNMPLAEAMQAMGTPAAAVAPGGAVSSNQPPLSLHSMNPLSSGFEAGYVVPVAEGGRRSPSFEAVGRVVSDSLSNAKGFNSLVEKLTEAGFDVKENSAHGINWSNVVIKDRNGEKFMLKEVDDRAGGGALIEHLASQLFTELGIKNVKVPDTQYFKTDKGEFLLSSWIKGFEVKNATKEQLKQAVVKTGVDSVAKMLAVSYLAGDPDRHYRNYLITDDGHLTPIDHGRMLMYQGFSNTFYDKIHDNKILQAPLHKEDMLSFLDSAASNTKRLLGAHMNKRSDGAYFGDRYFDSDVFTKLDRRLDHLKTQFELGDVSFFKFEKAMQFGD
jgi:hypothetical protein